MKKIVSGQEMAKMLERLAFQLIESTDELEKLTIVGIQRRGVYLAQRIHSMIEKHQSISLEIGSLDITFYRDDLKHISEFPTVYSTNINFPIEAREIALIDDVLYTGRTVKAALDAIFDLGRPKKISMTALIDQGHRELPIRADFVGKLVPTSRKEIVHVHMQEIDDDDGVYISEGL